MSHRIVRTIALGGAALLVAAGAVATAAPSIAAPSSSQQWVTSVSPMTTASGGSADGSAVGDRRTLTFGTTGVTAIEQTTAIEGPCWMGDYAHSSSGAFASTGTEAPYIEPDPPAGLVSAEMQCYGWGSVDGQGNSRDATITFSKPVISPIIHLVNLDASQFTINAPSGTILDVLSSNTQLERSGSTFNMIQAYPLAAGCQADDGSNRSGGCGSVQLATGTGALTSFGFHNDTQPPYYEGAAIQDDGWHYTMSFPVAPVTASFADSTIRTGETTELTLTIANPDAPGAVDMSNLDFTDMLPSGLTLADATVTTSGTCGAPQFTAAGGGALAVGSTSLRASNLTLPRGASCSITLTVTAPAGTYTNDTPDFSSSIANVVPGANTTLEVTDPFAAIGVVADVDATGAREPGDIAHFTFVVSNDGNVPLENVTVTPDGFTGSGTPTIVCPATTLGPGDDMTCVADYPVTQDDIDQGGVQFPVRATGTPTEAGLEDPEDSDSAAFSLTRTPAIELSSAGATLPPTSRAGDLVPYTFVVTNTGNVTLTDVDVDPQAFTGDGGPLDVVCPDTSAGLEPGASITCTVNYPLAQGDIDRGTIDLTAVATGEPVAADLGPVASDPQDVPLLLAEAPGIAITTTTDAPTLPAPGETLRYIFTVENTGNVTLTDIAVAVGSFSGTGALSSITCPRPAPLAPGATLTCSADYVVTAADAEVGSLTLAATATGVSPAGTDVASAPSDATTPRALAATGAVADLTLAALLLALGALLVGVRRRVAS